jgi:hypothetical protein
LGARPEPLDRDRAHALGSLLERMENFHPSSPHHHFHHARAISRYGIPTHLSMQYVQGFAEMVIKVGCRIQILEREAGRERSFQFG